MFGTSTCIMVLKICVNPSYLSRIKLFLTTKNDCFQSNYLKKKNFISPQPTSDHTSVDYGNFRKHSKMKARLIFIKNIICIIKQRVCSQKK